MTLAKIKSLYWWHKSKSKLMTNVPNSTTWGCWRFLLSSRMSETAFVDILLFVIVIDSIVSIKSLFWIEGRTICLVYSKTVPFCSLLRTSRIRSLEYQIFLCISLLFLLWPINSMIWHLLFIITWEIWGLLFT